MNGTRAGVAWPGRVSLVAYRIWHAAAFLPLVAAVLVFGAVLPTVLPYVANWDTAEFQAVGPLMGTAHPTGYASYVVLGWLASVVLQPFGDPAYRMDVLQALTGAAAVAGTAALITQLTRVRWIGFGIAIAMGATTLFWRLSTHADPHMFHIALLTAIFVLLVGWEHRARSADDGLRSRSDRWLVAAAAVYGIAVANHSLALLLAPGIGLFVLAVRPRIFFEPRLVAMCAGALAITLVGFMLELPIRAAMHAPLVYGRPDTWDGFWYVVLAEQFRGSLIDPFGHLTTKLSTVSHLLSGWLGPLTYVAVAGFLVAVFRRPRYALLSGVTFAITCWFSASYANASIDRYYLGPLLIAFTWAGIALAAFAGLLAWAIAGGPAASEGDAAAPGPLARLLDAARALTDSPPGAVRSRLAGWVVAEPAPPAPRPSTPVARIADVPAVSPDDRPSRARVVAVVGACLAVVVAGSAALVVPERQQPSGRQHPGGVSEATRTSDKSWLHAVFAAPEAGGIPRDSVIISWWSQSTTLWYGQRIEGLRPDVWVIDDRTLLDENLGQAPDAVNRFLGKRPVFLLRIDGAGAGDWANMRRLFKLQQFKLPNGQKISQVVGRQGTT